VLPKDKEGPERVERIKQRPFCVKISEGEKFFEILK
jgi:hypothetical protein